jgi:hypothetical protein
MLGYQSKAPPQECWVVNGITKVNVPGQEYPLIFKVNYATLVDNNEEYESLVPFDRMKHGIKVDMVPPKYGGTGGITVEGEMLPYCFENEKVYWHISISLYTR